MYFMIKTIILAAFVTMIFVPNKVTVVSDTKINTMDCLKRLGDFNIFITLIISIKWI